MVSFCSSACLGQVQKNENFKNGYIAVMVGPAIPVGQFRNNESSNRQAGFAKTGLTFSAVDLGYRFKYVELTAMLMGSANFITQNVISRDNAWIYSGIFIGSVIPRDISKKVQTGVKVMLGYIVATSPEFSLAGVAQPKQSGRGLAITVGINARYNALDRWCAIADIYYLSSDPKFDNYKQKIRAINSTFGIGLRLK